MVEHIKEAAGLGLAPLVKMDLLLVHHPLAYTCSAIA
jgi:hypothetical protein